MSNRAAFLTMLALSEGTELLGRNHGYDVIVGSTAKCPILFNSYADHPRVPMNLGHGLKSSAAGRYQILARYYDAYKKQLDLPDFSPVSQDAIALQLIAECNALADIDAGDFEKAVVKCASRWASLPGASYGQHTNSLAALRADYIKAGGVLVG
jgi:muramidase (phage lysozyme)